MSPVFFQDAKPLHLPIRTPSTDVFDTIHTRRALPGSLRADLGPHGGALPCASAPLRVPGPSEQPLKLQHGVGLIKRTRTRFWVLCLLARWNLSFDQHLTSAANWGRSALVERDDFIRYQCLFTCP